MTAPASGVSRAPVPAAFPGLDAIRLIAASSVVFAHSYPIAAGLDASDPLAALGSSIGLGDYAVRVFLIMSGFLLGGSLHAAPDPLRYLANRLLRLVPGFAFAILVSVLLFAPLMSELGWRLIGTREAWSSIYWSISCLGDLTAFKLTAVPHPDLAWFMNGSLWFIRYQLVCYLVLLTLHMLLRRDSFVAAAATVLAVLTLAAPRVGLEVPLAMFVPTLPYFCSGVAFRAVYRRWGLPRPLSLAATLLLVAGFFVGLEAEALAMAGPVLVAALGSRRSPLSWLPERLGDISYGVYLFGWPAGLLVVSRLGAANPLVVFALSAPIVFVAAYAMHRLVEQPVSAMLRLHVLRWLPSFEVVPSGADAQASRGGSWDIRRTARALAYLYCLVMIARFTIYPYPFSLNWFGFQVQQLLTIGLVSAAIIACGDAWSRRASNSA